MQFVVPYIKVQSIEDAANEHDNTEERQAGDTAEKNSTATTSMATNTNPGDTGKQRKEEPQLKSNGKGIADKTREHLIRNTCEISLLATLHPRSSILVILQEMQDSGGVSYYRIGKADALRPRHLAYCCTTTNTLPPFLFHTSLCCPGTSLASANQVAPRLHLAIVCYQTHTAVLPPFPLSCPRVPADRISGSPTAFPSHSPETLWLLVQGQSQPESAELVYMFLFQLLSCAVNASCLALINSGISMKFLIGAVNCMIDENDAIILDPDNKQLKVCHKGNLPSDQHIILVLAFSTALSVPEKAFPESGRLGWSILPRVETGVSEVGGRQHGSKRSGIREKVKQTLITSGCLQELTPSLVAFIDKLAPREQTQALCQLLVPVTPAILKDLFTALICLSREIHPWVSEFLNRPEQPPTVPIAYLRLNIVALPRAKCINVPSQNTQIPAALTRPTVQPPTPSSTVETHRPGIPPAAPNFKCKISLPEPYFVPCRKAARPHHKSTGEILQCKNFFSSQESKATLMFVFENVKKNVVACHTSGTFSQTQFHECLLKCREASGTVFTFYRNIVKQYANVV
ncbi:hypothetical protein PR048_003605 [Dryococelus australis]|uniref:Uncharacterized protein n=1 Tax=Dryococelus australis TaxID=614101 RepID=A0ABQ9INK7_9NEOP|nr:hypothetical protein PR048_003605 [Dryococelus australis]